jgi:hypothetical protein
MDVEGITSIIFSVLVWEYAGVAFTWWDIRSSACSASREVERGFGWIVVLAVASEVWRLLDEVAACL